MKSSLVSSLSACLALTLPHGSVALLNQQAALPRRRPLSFGERRIPVQCNAFVPAIVWDDYQDQVYSPVPEGSSRSQVQSDSKETTPISPPQEDSSRDENANSVEGVNRIIPSPRRNGNIMKLSNQQEYESFLAAHTDKVVVVKIFAPWCRACKKVAIQYQQIASDGKYDGLPVVFAELTAKDNVEFIKTLGVIAMPTMQIYLPGTVLKENMPCGPAKVSLLKRKLVNVLNYVAPPSKEGSTYLVVR